MKDMIFFILFFTVVIGLSSIGLKSCSDVETKLKNDGLKSIVMEVWEGSK